MSKIAESTFLLIANVFVWQYQFEKDLKDFNKEQDNKNKERRHHHEPRWRIEGQYHLSLIFDELLLNGTPPKRQTTGKSKTFAEKSAIAKMSSVSSKCWRKKYNRYFWNVHHIQVSIILFASENIRRKKHLLIRQRKSLLMLFVSSCMNEQFKARVMDPLLTFVCPLFRKNL